MDFSPATKVRKKEMTTNDDVFEVMGLKLRQG